MFWFLWTYVDISKNVPVKQHLNYSNVNCQNQLFNNCLYHAKQLHNYLSCLLFSSIIFFNLRNINVSFNSISILNPFLLKFQLELCLYRFQSYYNHISFNSLQTIYIDKINCKYEINCITSLHYSGIIRKSISLYT